MALTATENRALSRFRDRVRISLGDRRVAVRLFGSKARGDDRPDSDFDVLVIAPRNDWRVRNKIGSAAMDALLEGGLVISTKTLSRRQFLQLRRDGSPFIRNVIRDARTL